MLKTPINAVLLPAMFLFAASSASPAHGSDFPSITSCGYTPSSLTFTTAGGQDAYTQTVGGPGDYVRYYRVINGVGMGSGVGPTGTRAGDDLAGFMSVDETMVMEIYGVDSSHEITGTALCTLTVNGFKNFGKSQKTADPKDRDRRSFSQTPTKVT